MPPIVALTEPEEFFGIRQVAPVDSPVAALEEGGDLLFEDVAHHSRGGVGDSQHFVLVIAGCADEGQLRAILVPLDVGPFAAAAGDIVTQGGTVLVWRQFQTDHPRPVQIDSDALNGRDYSVA